MPVPPARQSATVSGSASRLAYALPAELPGGAPARLLLFAFRRMGAHGLNDAQVTHAYVNAFGTEFRRPLVLTRAFMADCAATAASQISIAPCCCPRATGAEAAVLSAVASVEQRPERARLILSDLLSVRRADGVTAAAAALAGAFADAGLPIRV